MTQTVRIDGSTYRIEDNGVRFFLLEGTCRAALIDTGRNVPEAREIAESLTSLPIILLNTHSDPDHISGNGAFDEVYMSPAEEQHYREKGGTGRVIPLYDGDELELGGRTLRIIDNPGHTKGSIAVLDVERRVLIGGDSIQNGNIYMFGAHRSLETYIESLKRLQTMTDCFDVVFPSHGDFPVAPSIVEKLIEGAGQILAGEVSGEIASAYGMKFLLYKFDYAGFLGELPQNEDE